MIITHDKTNNYLLGKKIGKSPPKSPKGESPSDKKKQRKTQPFRAEKKSVCFPPKTPKPRPQVLRMKQKILGLQILREAWVVQAGFPG